jgi:hypothetical protein
MSVALAFVIGLSLMDPSAGQGLDGPRGARPDQSAGQSGLTIKDSSTAAGCVAIVADVKDQLVLSHPWHGPMYRLIDRGLEGRRRNGWHVVGGLVPTPNVAAQVGAISRTIEAVAWATPGQLKHPYGERPVRIVGLRSSTAPSCPLP